MNGDLLVRLMEEDLGQPQRRGAWLFWRCVFHPDTKPSLGVKDGRYYCFGCGASGDAVDWLVEYRKTDKREALRMVKGGHPQVAQPRPKLQPQPRPKLQPEVKASFAPPEDWQIYAVVWVDDCHRRLMHEPEGARALDYLHKRGLNDETIHKFALGYWPGGEVQGLGVQVAKCVTIPNFRGATLYGVKCRHADPGLPKYTSLKGSIQRLFVAGQFAPGDVFLLCEGEFDAMLAWQEVGDCFVVLTLGGCSTQPGTTDLLMLGLAEKILIAYDADEAGRQGAERMAALLGRKATIAQLPAGYKDITEAYLGGVDLWQWLKPYLDDGLTWQQWAASVGAVVRKFD